MFRFKSLFKPYKSRSNFEFLKNVVLVTAILLGTAYFMKMRMTKVLNRAREKRSQVTGLEYFARNFLFKSEKGDEFKITTFPDIAIVVNYIISSEDESRKLIQSQVKLFKNLKKKDIIFLYVKDRAFNGKYFKEIKGLNDDNFIFVDDLNRSRELLPINKFPYSIIFDYRHFLIGKVDGFQDWNTKEKVMYFNKLLKNSIDF